MSTRDIEAVTGLDFQTVKTVTPAPAGMVRLQKLDTTGMVQVDPSGTTSPIGGGGGWFGAQSSLISAFAPLVTETPFLSEMASTSVEWESASAAGSGAVTNPAYAGAAVQLASGATANSVIALQNKGGGSNPLIGQTVTEDWAAANRSKLTTAIDAQARISILCVTDGTADWMLAAWGAGSTANFVLALRGAGNTIVDTGVPLDTLIHTHWLVKKGATLYWFMDGVQKFTMTDFTQAGAGSSAYTRMVVLNGTTAAARTLICDKYMVMSQLGS